MNKLIVILAVLLSGCMLHKSKLPQPGDAKHNMFKYCWLGNSGVFDMGCQILNKESKLMIYKYAPITVITYGYFDLARVSVKHWNDSLGFKLFHLKRKIDITDKDGNFFIQPTVVIRHYLFGPAGLNGKMQLKRVAGRKQSWISIYPGGRNIETMVHELGHALGLKHDKGDRRSVMHPYSNLRYMPRIQKVDLKLLRHIYKK